MKYKVVYVFYICVGLLLFPFYLYRINPDATAYFGIAQKLATGNFTVYGFWSPLLSWILVPFLWIHVPVSIAYQIIQLIFGLITLREVKKLIFALSSNPKNNFYAWVASLPVILYFVYSPLISPDLIGVYFLLAYLNQILLKKPNGIVIGVYGALAYFAKTYNLFFFLIHFLIVSVYKKNKINFVKALVTFCIIISPWVVLISIKYDHFTIGTAGAYNFDTSKPGANNNLQFYAGLQKPDNGMVSIWGDPTNLPRIYHQPASFVDTVKDWMRIILKNIWTITINYEAFSIFAIIIIAYSIKSWREKKNFFLLATFLFFTSGYVLYHIEDRYIWFGVILLYGMAIRMKVKKLYLLVLLLSFAVIPVKRIVSNINYRKEIYIFSNTIQVSGNIASNGHWNDSLYIVYYNHATYFGISNKDNGHVLSDLHKNNIVYLLVWNDSKKYSFLKTLVPVQTNNYVKIYKVD